MKFGLKRLAKVEKKLEEKRKQAARRYNKCYPGELVHFDTKRSPFLKGEDSTRPREYLFVAIDDFSRELYAGIYPDKTQYSSTAFLQDLGRSLPALQLVAIHQLLQYCQPPQGDQRNDSIRKALRAFL